MRRRLVVLFVVSALAGVAAPPPAVFAADPDGGPALAWDTQFGTDRSDIGRAVAAAPDGTVVVAGSTWGTLADMSAIGEDAFVRTYSAAGEVGWTHQFGTSNGDGVPGVAVAPSGRIFVAGYTGAALAGQTSSGYSDGFVRAYDADGTALWTRQFGSEFEDDAMSVAVGGDGNVAVTGNVGIFNPEDPDNPQVDVYARSYTPDGVLRWERLLGAGENITPPTVASDAAGRVFVAGATWETLDGATRVGYCDNGFLAAYGDDGSPLWARQFWSGECDDTFASAVAADGLGHVLVAGVSEGYGVFVRSYNVDGTLGWAREFGDSPDQRVAGLAVDPVGDAFVTGTSSDFDTRFNWVRAYAADGTFRWERSLGDETPSLIASDAAGDAIVAGVRASDAFVRKYGPTPPTAKVAALPAAVLATSTPVTWSGIAAMHPIAAYDVRYRRAAWNGGFGAYGPWLTGTTDTSGALTVRAGSTYCVSARAHDDAGLTSGWTAETCTAVPLDDRSLTRSGRWTLGTSATYYRSTYLRSSTYGAKLTRTGVVAKRVALLATTCPTCGTVKVYWGPRLLKTVSLYSRTTVYKKLITVATFTSARSGTLSIKVSSSGKKVIIDGVAIRRN